MSGRNHGISWLYVHVIYDSLKPLILVIKTKLTENHSQVTVETYM